MRIGVLAVQGAFVEHIRILNALDVETFEIRQKTDLSRSFDGLVLPGGESTVMGKLLRELELFHPLKERIVGGIPVFGTCAGLILLANRISNDENTYFGCMDIVVKRNAYGRQLGSFSTTASFNGIGKIPMVFIRAPYIESVGKNVHVLSQVEDRIVAAQQEHMLVTAFHPELTNDVSVHQYFLGMI